MKRLAQTLTLGLILQSIFSVHVPLVAQTPPQVATPYTLTESSFRRGKDSANVQGDYAEAIKRFEEFVQKQMALDKTPGLSVGFMKDDFVWAKGYGYSDLENRVPTKPESAYRLASVTKPMTAVAILQLVEKGKINLDTEVQTYVSYFPKKPWPVTVRQLLGHLGGISHYKNAADELHIKTRKSTREAIAIFENFDLVAEPGTRYSYTSYGYNLLGAVIEAASGMSYSEYMRQNVWQPLGMTDTRMDDPLEVIPNRVRGYQLVGGELKNSEFVDISSRFAAGGTRSTVPDLLKFAKGIMSGKLLSADNMNLAATSMSTREGMLTNYGMGWDTRPQNGRYALVHGGSQQETGTFLYILPRRNLALAIAVNYENSDPWPYIARLSQLITGEPPVLTAYSSDKTKSAASNAMNAAFNYGLPYFEQMQKPLTSDPEEMAQAFAYFNRFVNPEMFRANSQEATKKIREGVHPVANRAFAKVGSYMAARLSETYGPAKLGSYPALGSLAFFQDYIGLSQSDANIPKFTFNAPFSQLASEMSRDWSKTNSEYVRQLALMPDADFDDVGKKLRQSFAGATVYPNLVDPLFRVTRQLLLNKDSARALKVAQLAEELYPEAAEANLVHGVALIVSGDAGRAPALLKKSASINPNGPASASGLNNVAYQLFGVGMVDHGMAVLRAAIELHPQEANLYDSLGEFHLSKGEKAKALESYKKALETNPNFENAATAREIVKKLSAELGGGR